MKKLVNPFLGGVGSTISILISKLFSNVHHLGETIVHMLCIHNIAVSSVGFTYRIKLMAEGELKDMEQFFDDLSDSFSGTEPEVHKTSVVGKKKSYIIPHLESLFLG